MRVMVMVKASPQSEAGEMPSTALIEAMGKYNEELVKAGDVDPTRRPVDEVTEGPLVATELGEHQRPVGLAHALVDEPQHDVTDQHLVITPHEHGLALLRVAHRSTSSPRRGVPDEIGRAHV